MPTAYPREDYFVDHVWAIVDELERKTGLIVTRKQTDPHTSTDP